MTAEPAPAATGILGNDGAGRAGAGTDNGIPRTWESDCCTR
ncbi:MAG: hypothetical protein QM765_48580 [Myxococcales bacterium]